MSNKTYQVMILSILNEQNNVFTLIFSKDSTIPTSPILRYTLMATNKHNISNTIEIWQAKVQFHVIYSTILFVIISLLVSTDVWCICTGIGINIALGGGVMSQQYFAQDCSLSYSHAETSLCFTAAMMLALVSQEQ